MNIRWAVCYLAVISFLGLGACSDAPPVTGSGDLDVKMVPLAHVMEIPDDSDVPCLSLQTYCRAGNPELDPRLLEYQWSILDAPAGGDPAIESPATRRSTWWLEPAAAHAVFKVRRNESGVIVTGMYTYQCRVTSPSGETERGTCSVFVCPLGGRPEAYVAQLQAPKLASPRDGSRVWPDGELCWSKVWGANTYNYQVAPREDLDEGIGFAYVGHTPSTETYIDIAAHGSKADVLYWRVRAVGAKGEGPWSETRSFIAGPEPENAQRSRGVEHPD